jgi:hypothetical protein
MKMKNFFVIILLSALGLMFLFTAPSKGAVNNNFLNLSLVEKANTSGNREVKKEFNVKPGGKLTIDLKTGGSIKIEGWDKDIVSADVLIKKENENNPVEVEFSQNGDEIEILSDYREHTGHNQNSSTELKLKVPVKFNVNFSTMGGGITVESLEGNVDGKTMGGAISFSEMKGYLDVQTMGGGITLRNSDVDGKVQTMGGSIDLANVNGDVDISTMGGAIMQTNVHGKKDGVGKEVHVSTMGGPINVDEAPNGANVKTMGGNISINKAGNYVVAETMGGDIEIKALDGGATASTQGGDIDVTMIGNPAEGKRDVSLKSNGGDITLLVPEDLSMDVDIEVTLKDDESDSFNDYDRIISDFKIDIERSEKGHISHKYIKGFGEINGGKNHIKIRTINGKVYLKKA